MSDNRDRLIKLIQEAEDDYMVYEMGAQALAIGIFKSREEYIADHLIANGVIVPPCKVEQQLWFVENGEVKASTVDRLVYEELSTDDIFTRIEGYGFSVFFEDVGKIVFITREEAEKALERSKGNA